MFDKPETQVHFHKAFGIMEELFMDPRFQSFSPELRASIGEKNGPSSGFTFLDLGCAPGGFSAYLGAAKPDPPYCRMGFGVTLPLALGGFFMGYRSERMHIQFRDLMTLKPPDLDCGEIDMAVADAQYLPMFYKQKQRLPSTPYRGIRVRCQSLGIWALIVLQCHLVSSKMKEHGIFIFRFSWRGTGGDTHPTGEKVSPELLRSGTPEHAHAVGRKELP